MKIITQLCSSKGGCIIAQRKSNNAKYDELKNYYNSPNHSESIFFLSETAVDFAFHVVSFIRLAAANRICVVVSVFTLEPVEHIAANPIGKYQIPASGNIEFFQL